MHTYPLIASLTTSSPSAPLKHSKVSKPEWSRARQLDRLSEAYKVIEREGGKTFTLRLHLDALIAVTGAKDPARTMSKRVQNAFRRAGLYIPHFAFQLEVTLDEREELHLHGAISLGNLPPKLVKEVLRNAAGKIPGRAGSRQVQLKNFNWHKGGPEGWARYPTKAAARTRRVIQHTRLIYISRNLSQLARDSWEESRRSPLTCH